MASIKILVTEDEEKTRVALLSRLKQLLGDSVLTEAAADGGQAVEKALRFRPDLILMDIEMPVRSGLEAAAILRQQLPETRVIFLTAYDRFDYAVGALRSGGQDYLLKPVSDHDLRECIQRLFGPVPEHAAAKSPFESGLSVFVQSHYAEDLTLEAAAEQLGMSPFYFSRQIKSATGKTFLEYLTAFRLEKAKQLLASTELSVAEIGRAAGYPDANYFSKVFKREEHCTPSAYRSRQEFKN